MKNAEAVALSSFFLLPSSSCILHSALLEPAQPGHLEHHGAAVQTPITRERRIPVVGVHNEELAPRLILPTEAKIAAEDPIRGAVLKERAQEHPRAEPIIGAGSKDSRG